MRYRISAALIVMAAVLVASFGFASADSDLQVGTKDNGLSICEEHYLNLYERAHEKFGASAVGANVVDDGTGKYDAYDLPESLCQSKAETLDLMLNPPPAPEPVEETYTDSTGYTEPTESYTDVTTSAGGCSGMEAESGSMGYAEPGGDGYVGCYQIAESHYSAGGSCSGLGTDPAGQDACAAIICETEGAGAWTNAAGANPC